MADTRQVPPPFPEFPTTAEQLNQIINQATEAATAKERKRCASHAMNEYKSWREAKDDYGHEFDLIAVGASGAAANMLIAIHMGNEVDD